MKRHTCKVTFDYTIEGDGKDYKDVVLEVTANREPDDPGCHTMKNGDPGWPPSTGDVEILTVKVDGKEVPESEWSVWVSPDNLIDKAGEEECPHLDDDEDRDDDREPEPYDASGDID